MIKYTLNIKGRVIMDEVDKIREIIGCSFICGEQKRDNGETRYTVVIDKKIENIKDGKRISNSNRSKVVPTDIGDFVVKFTKKDNDININTVFRVDDTRDYYPFGIIIDKYDVDKFMNVISKSL